MVIILNSGTSCRTISSTRIRASSVRSMRVPTGNSTLTDTSPSSVCGISSNPTVGSSTSDTTKIAALAASTVGRWWSDRPRSRRYRLSTRFSACSLRANSQPSTPRRWSEGVGSFNSREQSTGTSVTATNSAMPSEKTTTTESCLKRMLDTPLRNRSGTKTAICVRVEATIADHTSSQPSMDAWTRSLPISMWRNVFSRTTMEASTIMPIPRASPPNVSVFSVKPLKYSSANVPMTEIGIDAQMMSVDRTLRRKAKMMKTTKIAPRPAASRTAAIDAWI